MPVLRFICSMASGVTVPTTPVDTGGAGARNVSVYVPTMTSGTDVYFQASYDASTWARIRFKAVSGTVATTAVVAASSVTQQWIKADEFAGYRYYRPEFSTAMTATAVEINYMVEY
jgi:hypothetical protein